MSSASEHLARVMYTNRAPTQRGTIISLMRGSWASFEVARDLGISQNAANIALHELVKHGIVERPIRGRYRVREELVALVLLDRVRSLEKRMVKKGVKVDPDLLSPVEGRVTLRGDRGPKPTAAATEVV